MWTIIKGLLVLPFVAIAIEIIWIVGSMLLAAVGFSLTLLCIIMPLIFKAVVVGSIVLGLLWGLGKASSEIVGMALSGRGGKA